MTELPTLVVVETTVSSRREAESLARLCLDKHLAACIHIEEIQALYHWQGQVANEQEWRLRAKTSPAAADDLRSCVENHHPYEVPMILVYEVRSNAAYAAWAGRETDTSNQSTR